MIVVPPDVTGVLPALWGEPSTNDGRGTGKVTVEVSNFFRQQIVDDS
jgi:hypothetical protein